MSGVIWIIIIKEGVSDNSNSDIIEWHIITWELIVSNAGGSIVIPAGDTNIVFAQHTTQQNVFIEPGTTWTSSFFTLTSLAALEMFFYTDVRLH